MMQYANMSNSNDDEILVRCQHLGKRFCRDLKRSLYYGVQDIVNDFVGRQPVGTPKGAEPGTKPDLRPQEFWAVEDVSFDVRRGQCLGLVGQNGAGKTTILKMLSGLIKPDHGKVELRGRVGGLIALGAGFNPLLTGRENVYVNSAILGMSRKQIDSKFDAIEAFADIGEFIDAPVQSYSSGMQVRLGFAVAAVVIRPDVLLLDEVLAVGDMGFTMKCLNAVREMAADSAVIFVSHNMQWVSTFCTDVLVMKNGRVAVQTSNIAQGIGAYMECFDARVAVSGSGKAVVESAQIIVGDILTTQQSGKICEIGQGEEAELLIDANIESTCLPVILTLYILDQGMNPVICYPDISNDWQPAESGHHRAHIRVSLGPLELNAGRYSFVVQFQEKASSKYPGRIQGLAPFSVRAKNLFWAPIVRYLNAADQTQ
ncbi:MAG: ABC transporter ATP-binding protein [Verrucomicrobiaceae bacterium]|nr:ABC transporter ATP-binding protein [Verrucomicrobiaceae bacterium]